MNRLAVRNLLRIATRVEVTDPALACELVRSATAVINPGAKRFEQHVEDTVKILEGLKAELEKADKQLDTDDAAEFAKFFDDEAAAETEELRQMLKVSALLMRVAAEDEVAGIGDWLKNKFKKKDKEPEASPSYMMDDESMDDFVDGKKDWADPGTHVEKETRENKEFFEDADSIVKLLDKVRDKPSRNMVRSILTDINELIAKGRQLMKGERKVDKALQVDTSESDVKPGKPEPRSKPLNLDSTINHYTDMLKESAGDEKKTLRYLKEFFETVKPSLGIASQRRKMLPLLVRTANANPKTRPMLLPVIKRWTGR